MRRFAIIILALAMTTGATAHAKPLNAQAFTAAFAAAMTAALPTADVTVTGDLRLQTRGPNGGTTDTDLRNAYAVYLRDPAHLDAVIKRYAEALAEMVKAGDTVPAVDRSRIVPVIKSTAWVAAVQRRRQAAPAKQLLTEPLNAELTIVYVEDRPTSMRFLMTGDDVGDRNKLHELALANLNRLLPKIEMRALADGVFLISAGGSYEASLLLEDDIWSSGQIKVDGDIVVAVPVRDALLVAGSHNSKGIASLESLAARLVGEPYGLTATLFRYRGGKFAEFKGE